MGVWWSPVAFTPGRKALASGGTFCGGNENRSVPPALRGWRCDADTSEHEGPHRKQFGAVVTVVFNTFDLAVGERCFVRKNGLCILTSALVA